MLNIRNGLHLTVSPTLYSLLPRYPCLRQRGNQGTYGYKVLASRSSADSARSPVVSSSPVRSSGSLSFTDSTTCVGAPSEDGLAFSTLLSTTEDSLAMRMCAASASSRDTHTRPSARASANHLVDSSARTDALVAAHTNTCAAPAAAIWQSTLRPSRTCGGSGRGASPA